MSSEQDVCREGCAQLWGKPLSRGSRGAVATKINLMKAICILTEGENWAHTPASRLQCPPPLCLLKAQLSLHSAPARLTSTLGVCKFSLYAKGPRAEVGDRNGPRRQSATSPRGCSPAAHPIRLEGGEWPVSPTLRNAIPVTLIEGTRALCQGVFGPQKCSTYAMTLEHNSQIRD